jgi:hypothetical protein
MLALASLAALGMAWWAFGRLARGARSPLAGGGSSGSAMSWSGC